MWSLRGSLAVCLLLVGCSGDVDGGVVDGAPTAHLEVVSSVPHDTDAFTQGLVFDDEGRLFESIGHYGQSEVRELGPSMVLRRAPLDPTLFGEGLAAVGDELVQLTWQEGVALRWSADDLVEVGRCSYEGEGWGLTTHDGRFIQSDGSSTLTIRDAATFEPVDEIEVTVDGEPVDKLNELESVGGRILANVWHTNQIVVIDPDDGRVEMVIDAASIEPDGLTDPQAVLNGIAHRPGDPDDRLWLTGKRWPLLYEVRIVPD